ncbi:MAG: branched-chain amino acid ABC transporter permease, partial [Spirochaetaceae bacterium]
MELLKEIKRSAIIALWFVVLTFPIMVIRVNTIRNTVTWRFDRLLLIAIGGFVGSFVWNYIQARQHQSGSRPATAGAVADPVAVDVSAIAPAIDHAPIDETGRETWLDRLLARVNLTRESFRERRFAVPATIALIGFAIAFPFINSLYQTNVMVSALIYVILALGLNIVIGLGGMLHLGYAAFYAVGAYTYGLLNYHFGVSFWVALPIGAGLSTIFGILLAIPVLRLRGDYLAIVTLGFGEIIRIVLMNWQELSMGPSGVRGIARPGFFGMQMNLAQTMRYTYFICLALVVLTIFIVHRLENSRIGRQWVAMGEDDVAARAMGVNTVNAKMAAFAIGAFWAGMAGVIFAA